MCSGSLYTLLFLLRPRLTSILVGKLSSNPFILTTARYSVLPINHGLLLISI